MSSIVRSPDPRLVAIFLVIRSREGPRFVFHYPPNPLGENAQKPTISKTKRASRNEPSYVARSSDSSSGDDDSRSSSDEDEDDTHLLHNTSTSTSAGNKRMSYFAPLDENVAATATTTTTTTTAGVAAAAGGIAVSNVGGGEPPQRPGSLGSGRTSLRRRGGQQSDVDDESGSASDRRDRVSNGTATTSQSEVLGLTSDVWEKLLSPSRSWHKRRFEVGINDLAFIGWPVFVRDDGTWRKEKRKKKKKSKDRREWESAELGHDEPVEDTRGEEGISHSGERHATSRKRESELDANQRPELFEGDGLLDSEDSDKDAMTMFNVVFVLDPPPLGYSTCIRDMYDNIIKKFAKALKWEQARSDFIWRESQVILHLKEKAREKNVSVNSLYSDLIARSTLARAICTVYSSISASKIASVSLSQQVSISLQIPPLTSTSYLPGPNDTAYPGLWLTTADSVTSADDPTADTNVAPHQVLAKHFALLLLDNEATILKDIESSGGALAPALAHYIRCSKPTKSFAQISASSGIPLPTIQMLASHLVYWRRARAIPPLHQRDTYIVSPNCDLSKLEAASASYTAAFPTQPSLPKMLAALSGTPKPYGSFIPSKEHKQTYFAILAWLLRGGWVTQLRAFARVKVTPEIKLAVEKAIRREEVDKYLIKGKKASISSDDSNADSYRRRHPHPHRDQGHEEEEDEDDVNSSSSSSLASHGSGEETPVPHRYLADHDLHLSHSMLDQNTLLNVSSLILAPHRASPLESRWLDEIMARFPDKPRQDEFSGNATSANGPPNYSNPENAGLQTSLKKYWPAFVKYFNGSDALEKIPVREGLKRKLVWQMLMRLGLVTGQQLPIELDPREQVLVSVRHW